MSVTEQLMKAGGWSLRFRPDVEIDVRRRCTFFSNVMITPAHSGTEESFAVLKAQAIYSGIITRRAVRRGTISGLGLLGYLATGKASAGIWHAGYETVTFPAVLGDVIDHWFTGVIPYANGLRKGSNHADTGVTVASLSEGTLPDLKQSLDTVAGQTGNEYRVTPAGLVDYGTTVFSTRNILVSPDVTSGMAADWIFWEPVDWDPEVDVEDYRNTGRVLIQDKSNSGVSGSVVWSSPGVVPKMRTWDNDYSYTCIYTNQEKTVESMTLTDATKAAEAVAVNRAQPRVSGPCNVNQYAITRYLHAGDYLWLYDGVEGIQGTTHTGAPGYDYAALRQRVYGLQWPVEKGMGVYLVDGAFLTTPNLPRVWDITPYIEFETGPASLELGAPVSISGNSSLVD